MIYFRQLWGTEDRAACQCLGMGRGHGSACYWLRSVRMIHAFKSESPKVSLDLSLVAFWKRVTRGVWKLAKYSDKVAKLATLLWTAIYSHSDLNMHKLCVYNHAEVIHCTFYFFTFITILAHYHNSNSFSHYFSNRIWIVPNLIWHICSSEDAKKAIKHQNSMKSHLSQTWHFWAA